MLIRQFFIQPWNLFYPNWYELGCITFCDAEWNLVNSVCWWTTFCPTFWKNECLGGPKMFLSHIFPWGDLLYFLSTHLLLNIIQEIIYFNWCMIITKSFIGYIFSSWKHVSFSLKIFSSTPCFCHHMLCSMYLH